MATAPPTRPIVPPDPVVEMRITGISIDGGATYLDFELDGIMDDEAIAMEERFGLPWLAFLQGFSEGKLRALKAAWWIAARRDNPGLDPDEVHFQATGIAVRTEETVPLSEGEPSSEPDI